MIIYRDSDQFMVEEQEEESGLLEKRYKKKDDIMCAMEELAYNRRMTGSHAAPTSTNTNNNTGSNPFASLWEKRDINVFSAAAVSSSSPSSTVTQGCPTARKSKYFYK
jgi:hypothetical protein